MADINDIDITADLVDGSDGALANNVLQHAQDTAAVQQPGTQSAHGDSKPINQIERNDKPENASLREQLSRAFSGEEPAAVAAVEKPAITKGEDGKYRALDGTFASQEQITAFEAAQAAPAAAQSQDTYEPLLSRFTPAEQEQFKSLPAEIQQFVGRTMADLNDQAARFGEYDFIENQILGPRRAALQANGTSVPVALNQLFALSDFASTQPDKFVMWFAQTNNLDLDEILDAHEATQANVDPVVQNLQQTVAQLQAQVGQSQQTQQAAQHQANLADVQSFMSERDATNSLKRPYLTEVTDAWASQITAVRSTNPNLSNTEVLQKAYENACWASPEVRGKMQAETEQVRRTQEAQRVQQARIAGSSVTGAPVDNTAARNPQNNNLSLRDELTAQFAAQGV